MNIIEMYEKVKKIYEENEDKYWYIGLRFEDKQREIGEVCENSRHNGDREDERKFPEYGTEEYWEMEELDGTSAWDMTPSASGSLILGNKEYHPGMPDYNFRKADPDKEAWKYFCCKHCYVIASNELGKNDTPDDGEIVIRNAVVIAQIF